MNTHLWQEAAAFAARAHRHQLRKDHLTPYVSHPVRVAMTVALIFGFTDENILAAALLHDTIEDTNVDYEDLEEHFGRDAASFVVAMTKDMRLPETRRERAYDEQLKAGPWQGRLLKLADVYDNLISTWDKPSRQKQIKKTKRALALTANDRQLAGARKIVQALLKNIDKKR